MVFEVFFPRTSWKKKDGTEIFLLYLSPVSDFRKRSPSYVLSY